MLRRDKGKIASVRVTVRYSLEGSGDILSVINARIIVVTCGDDGMATKRILLNGTSLLAMVNTCRVGTYVGSLVRSFTVDEKVRGRKGKEREWRLEWEG